MKIESGAAQQAYAAYRHAAEPTAQAGQGSTPAPVAPAKPQTAAVVDISPEGRRFAQALDAVNTTPDGREARVAQIRIQVQNGTYSVNEHQLARHLVQRGTVGTS